jgi:hypothetical protein
MVPCCIRVGLGVLGFGREFGGVRCAGL